MDIEREQILGKDSKKLRRRDIIELKELIEKNKNEQNKKLYFFILIVILMHLGIVFYLYLNINKKEQKDKVLDKQILKDYFQNEIRINMTKFEDKMNMLESKINILKSKQNEENIINKANLQGEELPEISYEKFDENIFQEVQQQQMEFCNNQNKYIKSQFEQQIKIENASFLNRSFDMYVYKIGDTVSNFIRDVHNWEPYETEALINALNYYSSLKNIPNNNIYIIDIGANVGWHTFFLAKCGYQVLSFEASVTNIYILRKNFCLNQNFNITIINKGLYTEDKKCNYYLNEGNIGNGMIHCDKNNTVASDFTKSGEAYLTRLSNYVEFLSTKNVALIKIDIEGSEGKAIEGGIELISNYHIPFILLEFTPELLILHGTDPMQFLEMLEMNGYKFPKKNFFDCNYYTKQEIIENSRNSKDRYIYLYIVYSKIIKNEEKNITNNTY